MSITIYAASMLTLTGRSAEAREQDLEHVRPRNKNAESASSQPRVLSSSGGGI